MTKATDLTTMSHEQIMAESSIQIGALYVFDYPEEFTTLPEYSARRRQEVKVLRPTTADEADVLWDDPEGTGTDTVVDRMFVVQARDGWEGHAWESELLSGGLFSANV